MRKPMFNNIERQIIHIDNSLYASRMKMHIAIKRFEKAFMKTFVGRFIISFICRAWSEPINKN